WKAAERKLTPFIRWQTVWRIDQRHQTEGTSLQERFHRRLCPAVHCVGGVPLLCLSHTDHHFWWTVGRRHRKQHRKPPSYRCTAHRPNPPSDPLGDDGESGLW